MLNYIYRVAPVQIRFNQAVESARPGSPGATLVDLTAFYLEGIMYYQSKKGIKSADPGAKGQCSFCGRYSNNPDCLTQDYLCECGRKNGYSGSFKFPHPGSLWEKDK